jgi:formylmethanofuran dehydrogenase subunit A
VLSDSRSGDVVSWSRCQMRDLNIVGSIHIMDHLVCDLGQVTLLRLLRPLKET